ncbi:hypothetical protein ABEB36_003550 [Hypothenemus hampei]|uniref:T-box domain-containing protein n=1 Tax=Hypothenemus hampei TaxID=57062 RepID=A0ABD1FBD6_HYPHA
MLLTQKRHTNGHPRMFPTMQIQLTKLQPQTNYCLFLEMVPKIRCRYKYSSNGGWAPAGSEEMHSPQRMYMHPESPAKGEYWMSQMISFGKLKLTNTQAAPPGQIILNSMHKYQPRIYIIETSNPSGTTFAPKCLIEFPETQFIAVTAYQNEKITQLKIDNNPFAKGFRENGQAKCKRKRPVSNDCEEDEFISVDDDDHLQKRVNLRSSLSSSLTSISSNTENIPSLQSDIPRQNPIAPNLTEPHNENAFSSYFHMQYWRSYPCSAYCSPFVRRQETCESSRDYLPINQELPNGLPAIQHQQFTDFSINSILNRRY